MPDLAARIDDLVRRLSPLHAAERLALLAAKIGGRIVLTTSFGPEDQALTHLVATANLPFDVVTLDTGRLFAEAYDVWALTEKRYALKIEAIYPQTQAVETLVRAQGINGFYDSVDARKACCGVRKVEPLARALSDASVWITGLRGDQSAGRAAMPIVSHDTASGAIKVNPLIDWTREQVADFIAAHDVPVNALHRQGFVSIGCAPCTRAIRPGEHERAGRWWWEQEDTSGRTAECGLHVDANGGLVRAKELAS